MLPLGVDAEWGARVLGEIDIAEDTWFSDLERELLAGLPPARHADVQRSLRTLLVALGDLDKTG